MPTTVHVDVTARSISRFDQRLRSVHLAAYQARVNSDIGKFGLNPAGVKFAEGLKELGERNPRSTDGPEAEGDEKDFPEELP